MKQISIKKNNERFISVIFHPLVFHHNIISFVSIKLNLLEKKVAENLNDITLTTIKFIERCRITNSSIYGNNYYQTNTLIMKFGFFEYNLLLMIDSNSKIDLLVRMLFLIFQSMRSLTKFFLFLSEDCFCCNSK